MKADKNNSTGRYRIIIGLMTLLGLYIMGTALRTMLPPQKEYWEEVSKRFTKANIPEPAARGNLLGCDGQILVGTLPRYRLLMDFRVADPDSTSKRRTEEWREEAYRTHFDSLAIGLARIFPDYSVKWFRERLEKGRKSKRFSYRIYPGYASYIQYQECLKLPILCESSLKSGFHVEEILQRHKPYGPLASRTLGDLYRDSDRAKCGLELSFDSILRGTPGSSHRTKLRSEWHKYIDQKPIDGHDLMTTIDINLQDMVDRTLRNKLMEPTVNGELGIAVVMEVKTGDIKAIANLTRAGDGQYYEMKNNAVSDLMEPGSTFKTVALVSMFNDEKVAIDTSKRVQCGGKKRYSATSGEINAGHGYTTDTANLAGVLALSSNVGMCELAWEYYRNRREDMKKGIEAIFPFGKMHPDLDVIEPNTRVVPLNSDRDFLNLSYGYSATATPLQVVTFYNAIANNGKMVKPLFCREIIEGGRPRPTKPVVLKEHICSEEVAKQMRELLVGVVEHGTGDNVYNTVYGIGGKTGTTQGISDKSIKNSSFVGFFPADNPRYTCLVLVERTSIAGRHAAAPVFKKIADCVVAFDEELGSIDLQDSGRVMRPVLAKGKRKQLENAHKLLGLPFTQADSSRFTSWTVYDDARGVYDDYDVPQGVVPDCKGMTVRDAMALLRAAGL